jgi:hypothetical protein
VAVLEGLGFAHAHAHGSLESGNVFSRRGDVLVDLVPIRDDVEPPRTLGALEGIVWPTGFSKSLLVEKDGVSVQTLTPAMHGAMKEVVSAFYGSELRPKDRADLAALATLCPMTASDAAVRHRLTALAQGLRAFHSALLDFAKGEYEFLHGPIAGPFALYSLVMNDPAFQWLRPLSGLMATLDEVLDAGDTPLTPRNVADVRQALGLLFSDSGTQFADFRAGYARARGDARVRETEARWRESLTSLEA